VYSTAGRDLGYQPQQPYDRPSNYYRDYAPSQHQHQHQQQQQQQLFTIVVHGLDDERFTLDTLFNLFCQFGDPLKMKLIVNPQKGKMCLIEFANEQQVCSHFVRQVLMNKG